MTQRKCTFEDCQNKHDSHGFCANHARQYRKYGHPLSKEEKHENLCNARKADIEKYGAPCTGKHWEIKDTSRMRGKHPKSEFKKGVKTWNTGKKDWMTKEHKDAMISACIKYADDELVDNKIQRMRFNKVRKLVLARDDDTCQICGIAKENSHVDHIKSWSEHPELRFDMDNCRTVCMPCHYYVHYKRKLSPNKLWGHNIKKEEV